MNPEDDRAWDAAASTRFNAHFDRRAAEVDLMGTFRRLLAEHGEPVALAIPPGIDDTVRDALIEEARTNPNVIVVDHRTLAPMRAYDLAAIDHDRLNAAIRRLAEIPHAPEPQEPPMPAAIPLLALAAATGGLQSLPSPPTKAPKPPAEVQDAIQAAAEDRRDRKRVRNLRNIGHSADCAMDMAIGHQPCSCGAR